MLNAHRSLTLLFPTGYRHMQHNVLLMHGTAVFQGLHENSAHTCHDILDWYRSGTMNQQVTLPIARYTIYILRICRTSLDTLYTSSEIQTSYYSLCTRCINLAWAKPEQHLNQPNKPAPCLPKILLTADTMHSIFRAFSSESLAVCICHNHPIKIQTILS